MRSRALAASRRPASDLLDPDFAGAGHLEAARTCDSHLLEVLRCIAGALRALEFDRIVAVVAGLAVTPTGARPAGASCSRSTDAGARSSRRSAATTRGTRFLADHPGFPLRAPSDLEAILDALGVEGRALEPLRLLGLADYLESIEQSRSAIATVGAAVPDPASGWSRRSRRSGSEIADVRRKIEPSGEVADNASPALARDPRAAAQAEARGCADARSFLRGRDTAKYLQEQVVTDRNGRYVLMVRAEHRGCDPRHRPWRLGQRREPVPRAARDRRDQQRHRRARRAGSRGGPPHPARADRRVPARGPTTSSARSTSPPSST